MRNIPLTKVSFTKNDFENIKKPLQSGWVIQGKFVEEFENKWCEFTGAESSIAVSNCTSALHLVISALGIKAGDEVIVPSFTWVATANAVEVNGAKAVFCDIELDTYNIRTSGLRKLITKRTKAIIPVHLFGLSADMDIISDIASDHNLYIIEDAACAFGTKYKGSHVGMFGNAGCFSFHPRKAITTGEGGMITTNDYDLADKLYAMRDHGGVLSDYQKRLGAKPYLLADHPYLGYNFRMTDIHASIGCSQMDRADDILSGRKKIADKYNRLIDNIPWLKRTKVKKFYEHSYQAYVCLFSPVKNITKENVKTVNDERNKFMDYLKYNGIMTRPGTHAVHTLTYYKKKYKIEPLSILNSYIADKCTIAFPVYPDMTNNEFEFVADKISSYKLKLKRKF